MGGVCTNKTGTALFTLHAWTNKQQKKASYGTWNIHHYVLLSILLGNLKFSSCFLWIPQGGTCFPSCSCVFVVNEPSSVWRAGTRGRRWVDQWSLKKEYIDCVCMCLCVCVCVRERERVLSWWRSVAYSTLLFYPLCVATGSQSPCFWICVCLVSTVAQTLFRG